MPYVPLRLYADSEQDSLPHVILTSDGDWDPTVLDYLAEDNKEQFDAQNHVENTLNSELFDEFRNYYKRTQVNEQDLFYFDPDGYVEEDVDNIIQYCMQRAAFCFTTIRSKEADYASLKSFFNWMPMNVLKKTFELSTKYARIPASTILKKIFKYFLLSKQHGLEPAATGIVCSDTPAIDDGSTSAQIFVSTKILVTDVYGIKSDKQFANILEDNIQ